MKEIVSRIIKEEQAMRAGVEKAQSEAEGLLARARRQAAAIAENMSAQLKAAADKSREEARQAFQAEKEKVLEQTRNEAVELREKRSRDIPQLARQIFEQVVEIKV